MRKFLLAAVVAAALIVGLVLASPAQAATLDPDCSTATVHLTGTNVKIDQVRIFATAVAKLSVDVPAGCTDPYTLNVPKLGVSITRDVPGDVTSLPVTVSAAALTNADAGVATDGVLRYYAGDASSTVQGLAVSFKVTPLRYTAWSQTDAYYEAGFLAGDTINVRASLSVADWDANVMLPYAGRTTRLQIRSGDGAWPTSFGSGLIVKGDAQGFSLTTAQLGYRFQEDDSTRVLRFSYGGNASAAPNAALGDSVLVHAQD